MNTCRVVVATLMIGSMCSLFLRAAEEGSPGRVVDTEAEDRCLAVFEEVACDDATKRSKCLRGEGSLVGAYDVFDKGAQIIEELDLGGEELDLNGCGFRVNLSNDKSVFVIKNGTLRGVEGHLLDGEMADHCGSIVLEDVRLLLSNRVIFAVGKYSIEGAVALNFAASAGGPAGAGGGAGAGAVDKRITIASTAGVFTIADDAKLTIGSDLTLDCDSTKERVIVFCNEQSELVLENAKLDVEDATHATPRLEGGILTISGDCVLSTDDERILLLGPNLTMRMSTESNFLILKGGAMVA